MAVSTEVTWHSTTGHTTASSSDDWHTYLFNRASWGTIIAGVVTALVVQLLLNLLGLGIGAATISPAEQGAGPAAATFSIGAGIWWTIAGIIASFCGGAVAGRLCGAAKVSTARWHGLVAWSATTLVGFYLLASVAGSIVGGAFNVLGSTVSGIGRTAASTITGVAQSTNGDALQAQVRSLVNPSDTQSVQDDLLTYLRASVRGDQAAADAARNRAVDGLARVANVSPDEARNRLNQVEQQYRQTAQQARDQAIQAAEVARKNASRAGFFGFIALLLGAVAAWFGGGLTTPRNASATASIGSRERVGQSG